MTFKINPKIIENDDVEITTDADGALSIVHKPSSQKLGLDPDGTLNTPAVDTDSAAVTNDVTAGSVDTEELNATTHNGIRFASSPDDVNNQFAQLPSWGGKVVLIPGQYTDADWTERIEFPDTVRSYYQLDMSGSHIDIDSFTPNKAYIFKPIGTESEQKTIDFHGPSFINLMDHADPPAFAELNNITNSRIYIPGGRGPVDAVVRNHATAETGSQHMTRYYVNWRQCQVGYEILDAGVSNDRSFYYGQISNIRDTGTILDRGHQNEFWVQHEKGETGYNTTAYKFAPGCRSNKIHLTHSSPTIDTVLDIQGSGNQILHPLRVGSDEALGTSKLTVRPSHWVLPGAFETESFAFSNDWLPQHDTTGDGTTQLTNYGTAEINAGSTDGNVQHITSASRISSSSTPFLLYCELNENVDSNAIYRFGAWDDSNNYVMFVADYDNNVNWRAQIVVGGVLEADVDTGISLDGSSRRFMNLRVSETSQAFGLDREHVAETAVDVSSFSLPKYRAEVEVAGSPPSSRNAYINVIEQMSR